MLLRKGGFSFCTSSRLRAPVTPGSLSITSTAPSHIRRESYTVPPQSLDGLRGYATAASDSSVTGAERLAAWPKTPKPTPYEIFEQKAGAPYSKARFYELVKLYHPDKYDHSDAPAHEGAGGGGGGGGASGGGLSRATKLERYRMVVAANSILCDPARRRDYDMFGTGWGDKDVDVREATRARDRAWREGPNSPANNATWEDWERWRQRRDGGAEKQQPIFVSNGGFVVILCAFVVVGVWAQAAQASGRTRNLEYARDQRHHAISRDIRHMKMEQATLNPEARIQLFVKRREGWGYDGYPEQGHLPSGSTKS